MKFSRVFVRSHPIKSNEYSQQQVREYDKLTDMCLDAGYIPNIKTLEVTHMQIGTTDMVTLSISGDK